MGFGRRIFLSTVTALLAQVKIKGFNSDEVKPMAVRQPRYSKEEFARRGDEIYESQIRQQVEEGNHGKIVAIDIETGAFELADDTMVATRQLYERLPDAQPWVVRIGYRAVHRFGARSLKDSL
jgi:hypothetical protein